MQIVSTVKSHFMEKKKKKKIPYYQFVACWIVW